MSNLAPTSLAYALLHAAKASASVFNGQSLAENLLTKVDPLARPAVQDLLYNSLRRYGWGDFILARLMERPLDVPEIRALLLVALARLEARPEATHTTVDQAVLAAGELIDGRLRGLVNAVLRNYLRRREDLAQAVAANDVATHQHPGWWLEALRAAWPNDWQSIASAGNQPPPMALRVNQRRVSPETYLAQLEAAEIPARRDVQDAILLDKPVPVERLPGFAEGLASVQDPGAQRAAFLLDPAPGSRVLDACAAPGGKAAHLLERADLDLVALDLKPPRCRRIEENLARLGLTATIKVADCIKKDTWWDGQLFDAILADVPCTASGVVRRNPDAKWLRRFDDIASFSATQSRMLDALWLCLRPGGKLLYATCSVFAAENTGQISQFLKRQPKARRISEEQLLPAADHDGFFYCLLEKRD
ncbi:MAG: 16S rRNA (cytosine(967)-C(5))-methyltransferase RsmB [Rhodocyclaceae bacterium]|nr:16S rRNA (cytosine(967)-C(5))-methyltransferase RsmB [Rhodocyclaceae bacterium]